MKPNSRNALIAFVATFLAVVTFAVFPGTQTVAGGVGGVAFVLFVFFSFRSFKNSEF